MKFLSPLVAIVLVLAFASCNKPCSSDSACTEFTPPTGTTCMMYVEGYYYNKNTNSCEYYSGSGCNAPPFKLRSDCTPCECP